MGEVKVDFDMPCRGCGYNLRGLDLGGSCPECGREAMASVRGYVEESDVVAEQRRRLSAQPLAFLKWVQLAALCAITAHAVTWTVAGLVYAVVDVRGRLEWAPWVASLGSVAGAGAVACTAVALGIARTAPLRIRLWMFICALVAAVYPLVFLSMATVGRIERNEWQSVVVGGMTAATMLGVVLRWVYVGSFLRGWKWTRLGWAALIVAILLAIYGALLTMSASGAVNFHYSPNVSPSARSMAVPSGSGASAAMVHNNVRGIYWVRSRVELVTAVFLIALTVVVGLIDAFVGVLVWRERQRRKSADLGGTDVQ